VADVVYQRQRLGQIFIQAQRRGHRAGDLRDFDGVSQAVAEVVGKARREDLGLGFQAAKCARVDNAIAVALERVAVGVLGLGITAAQAAFHRETKALEHVGGAYGWPGSSLTAVMASWLTAPALVRSGSSNLRASAGLVGAMALARAIVAWSVETKSLG